MISPLAAPFSAVHLLAMSGVSMLITKNKQCANQLLKGTDMAYWINTVSRDHVQIGMAGGFTQANHGKATNLKR